MCTAHVNMDDFPSLEQINHGGLLFYKTMLYFVGRMVFCPTLLAPKMTTRKHDGYLYSRAFLTSQTLRSGLTVYLFIYL